MRDMQSTQLFANCNLDAVFDAVTLSDPFLSYPSRIPSVRGFSSRMVSSGLMLVLIRSSAPWRKGVRVQYHLSFPQLQGLAHRPAASLLFTMILLVAVARQQASHESVGISLRLHRSSWGMSSTISCRTPLPISENVTQPVSLTLPPALKFQCYQY
jgi:hypothetical protein